MSGQRKEAESAVLSLQLFFKKNDLRKGLELLYNKLLRMYLVYSNQTIFFGANVLFEQELV